MGALRAPLLALALLLALVALPPARAQDGPAAEGDDGSAPPSEGGEGEGGGGGAQDDFSYIYALDTCILCMGGEVQYPCFLALHRECSELGHATSALMRFTEDDDRSMPDEVCAEILAEQPGPSTWFYLRSKCLHPVYFNPLQAAQLAMYAGGFPPETMQIFSDHVISGEAMSILNDEQLIDMGIPTGLAVQFVRGRDDFMEPSFPVDPKMAHSGVAEVQASIVVISIYGINEVDFSFQAQLELIMTWRDAAIFDECNGVDDKIDEDACQYVWRPKLDFTNARELDVTYRSLEADAFFGQGTYRTLVTGTFSAPMGFKTFPGDVQELPIRISFSESGMLRSNIMFAPVVGQFSPSFFAEGGKDSISGWEATAVRGEETAVVPIDLEAAAGPPGSNLRDYIERIREFIPDWGQNLNISTANCVITVRRLKSFYTLNYVMLILVLTALSWVVFIVEPSELSDRCQIALALVLALNVFQLILNDNMPKTGYLTPLHVQIIGSTFFIVITCLESVVVNKCAQRSAVRASTLGKIKNAMKVNLKKIQVSPRPSGEGDAEKGGLDGMGPGGGGGGGRPAHTPTPPPLEPSEVAPQRARDAVIMLEEFLAEYLDRISLIVFPVTYAIFTGYVLGVTAHE